MEKLHHAREFLSALIVGLSLGLVAWCAGHAIAQNHDQKVDHENISLFP